MPIRRRINAPIAGTALLLSLFFCACAPQTLELEMRLQRLEDRESIRRLQVDYGRFLDRRDFASFSNLFAAKDGEWIGGMGKAKGRENIRSLMEKTIGTDAALKNANLHIFANETIDLDGDRAKATAKWMFVVAGEGGRPQPVYLGHYEDDLIRESGDWKFARRIVRADIPSDEAISSR